MNRPYPEDKLVCPNCVTALENIDELDLQKEVLKRELEHRVNASYDPEMKEAYMVPRLTQHISNFALYR